MQREATPRRKTCREHLIDFPPSLRLSVHPRLYKFFWNIETSHDNLIQFMQEWEPFGGQHTEPEWKNILLTDGNPEDLVLQEIVKTNELERMLKAHLNTVHEIKFYVGTRRLTRHTKFQPSRTR